MFYAYDALHRLQSETDSLGHVTTYTYDSASNPQQRTDARGLVTKYFVDEANRPDRGEHWNGATLVDTVDFTLDIAGNRTQMVDPSGTTKYAYDALDRPTCIGPNTITGPCPSGNVGYQYDDLPAGSAADYPGQRTKIMYPDGKYADYTYLADGSMSSVTDWLSKQTTYQYDDAGALTTGIYPNNACTTYGYDEADRLLGLTNRSMASPPTCSPSDTVISAFTYITDAVGNRTAMGDLAGNQGYQYDALHRLNQVTSYPGPQTDNYTYDPNGNRLTKNAANYSYNAAEELSCSWSGSPTPPCPTGSLNYGYDNNGNQTSRGTDTFTYDHENRLSQSVIGGVTSSSVYNGDGLRMSHTVSGQTTSYKWDAAAKLPVVLQDGSNTYVYGLDLISATDNAGTQTYFLHDGIGSTTDLTDGSGNSTATYRYDAFGAIRSQTGSSSNQWLFTGEQRDGDSSMYYLRARYYDSSTGRFLSQDPAHAGHPYVYVGNNPVLSVDPYGLDACDTVAGMIGADDECRWVADKAESAVNAGGDAIGGGLNAVGDVAEAIAPYAVQCASWGISGAVIGGLSGGIGAVPGAAIGCATGVLSQVVEDYAPGWAKPGLQCATWALGAAAATTGFLARGVSGAIACGTAVSSLVESKYGPGIPATQCMTWGTGASLGVVAVGQVAVNPVAKAGLAACAAGGISDLLINGWSSNY